MRQRIDITEVEADTKIRGKYLRALENEEWALLPGPTFVKSFLRTYADYLGLDGRSLVEEFKLKFERPEMQAIAPPRPREQGRRQHRGGRTAHRAAGGCGSRSRSSPCCCSGCSSWAAATTTRPDTPTSTAEDRHHAHDDRRQGAAGEGAARGPASPR